MTKSRFAACVRLTTGVAIALLLSVPAHAQDVSINFGQGSGLTERVIQLIALLTVLSLAPSILVMMTSFTRIVVVLSLLRTALGTATAPPNAVIVSLALFLTAFVMGPAFQRSYEVGIRPLVANEINAEQAFERSAAPFKAFMLKNVREKDLKLFNDLAKETLPSSPDQISLRILIPAFMISELRRAFEMRMVRAGMLRMHWVTEWQRRGVPHLHGVLWWPDIYDMDTIVRAWIAVAEQYGAGVRGQHAAPITNAVGWFQYLSKHAARGVLHYQRSAENIPPGWRERTGRVWGKVGDWPVRDAIRINLQDQHGDGGWFAFRRLCRSWRMADARANGDRWRVRSARQMLKCPCEPGNIGLSRVRGVSEWIPSDVQTSLLSNLAVRGYQVVG